MSPSPFPLSDAERAALRSLLSALALVDMARDAVDDAEDALENASRSDDMESDEHDRYRDKAELASLAFAGAAERFAVNMANVRAYVGLDQVFAAYEADRAEDARERSADARTRWEEGGRSPDGVRRDAYDGPSMADVVNGLLAGEVVSVYEDEDGFDSAAAFNAAQPRGYGASGYASDGEPLGAPVNGLPEDWSGESPMSAYDNAAMNAEMAD